MLSNIKGNLNPLLGRIGQEKIAKSFLKHYKKDEDSKLREAAQSFESYFIQMMLKSMRKTIPNAGLTKKGLDYDIYLSMFDEEISKKMSERNSIGLSKIICNAVQKKHHIENSIPIQRKLAPKSLKPENKFMPLDNEKTIDKLKTINKKIEIKKNQSSLKFNDINTIYDRVNNFNGIIKNAAEKYNLEPSLIKAVIAQESGGKPGAVSSSGAKGLMQLIDITAKEVGVKQIFNPNENILGGSAYLRKMLNRNNGDLELALASYNAGPGNVEKYNCIPPFKETKNSIKKILKFY